MFLLNVGRIIFRCFIGLLLPALKCYLVDCVTNAWPVNSYQTKRHEDHLSVSIDLPLHFLSTEYLGLLSRGLSLYYWLAPLIIVRGNCLGRDQEPKDWFFPWPNVVSSPHRLAACVNYETAWCLVLTDAQLIRAIAPGPAGPAMAVPYFWKVDLLNSCKNCFCQ